MAKKPTKTPADPEQESQFFEPYTHYNNLLRTWLVAYGIGGPAVLVTNKDLFQDIAAKGNLAVIGWLFLIGVAAQVMVALLNKIVMWYLYYGEGSPEFRSTRRYLWSDAISDVFWPDILADILSVGTIGTATFLLFQALV